MPLLGYGLQFTMPFASVPLGGQRVYRVQFYRKGYSSSVTELQAGGAPWKEETPEIDTLTGLLPKKISLVCVSTTSVDLASFYTRSDREMLVELQLKTGTNTYTTLTTGWLNPYNATELYQYAPYHIRLTATCGLGSLQDYPLFVYPNKVAYADRVSVHDLLYNCLSWTGYDLPLRTWTGRYEQSMLVGGTTLPADTYDPLLNVRVNPRRWLKTDGTYESCKKVLDDLCTMYGAVLTQVNGRWCFLSQDARITSPNPQKWHQYDSPLAASPTVVTESLTYNAGTGQDVRWERGTSVGVVAPKKKLSVGFDYGNPVNLLSNGDFSSGGSGWTVNQLSGQAVTFEGSGTEDSPFVVRIAGQSTPGEQITGFPVTPNVRQTISMTRGTRTIVSTSRGNGSTYVQTDTHLLKLSGLFINATTKGAKIALSVIVDGATYWLQKDGTWLTPDQALGPRTYTLLFDNIWEVGGNIQAKPTSGEQLEVTSEPVPGLGNYTIRLDLFPGEPILPPPASGFKSIKYWNLNLGLVDGTVIPLKGEKWTVTVPGDTTDRQRQEDINLPIADQLSVSSSSPQALRYGAMTRPNGNPTVKWLLNGRLDRFQKLTAWSWLRWLSAKLRTMDGTVYRISSRAEPHQLTTVGVSDMTPPFSGAWKRWSWDAKNQSVAGTLHEEPPSLLTETYKGNYETPEGVLVPVVEPNDDTQPVPVPSNPTLTPRQNTGTTATKGLGSAGIGALIQGLLKATPKPTTGP